jgi:hypothetical protein
MTIIQYIASIGLLGLGGIITVFNGCVFIRQFLEKPSPSVVPIVGGVILFVGALIYPNGLFRAWAVIGLFIDYGCLPYLIFSLISLIHENRKFAEKNRLFSLQYTSSQCDGQFHLYPNNECIHHWKAKDGKSYGSMVMKIINHEAGKLVSIALQNIRVSMIKKSDQWELDHEEGWGDQVYSLADSTITEISANKALHRTSR